MKLAGNILTADGWINGHLTIKDGLIAGINRISGEIVTGAPCLIPGFIDLHVHGGGGYDIMQGGEAARVLARTHARFGSTSVLATTMTAPPAAIDAAFAAVAAVRRNPPADGADILGIHLEGPFINPEKLGAQPAYAIRADKEFINRLNAAVPIRIITIAPEFAENLALIPWLGRQNIRVQIGHTLADYEQCCCALQAGAKSFTHLYNAMSPLSHRAAGAVGAALAHARYCEIIPDLVHVGKGAMRAAMRAIPRLYGITDGTAACGMPDGQYRLGENDIYKQGNAVRLADGTLAGSVLTLDKALKNFIRLGDSLAQASHRLSAYQADYLGLQDRGRLEIGLRADLNIIDTHYNIIDTYIAGRRVGRDKD
ncbi:N-acetylglucosamine-6-phosphate deacetylase [Candidatus Tokpelaia sp.]|uniref:N-acetylglucosamine-6-phosphate deacetylase n=1 Tax=Candidatus Tokpelaia sp. TaxID=2233777 RepID=UPI001238A013|nr:N-acetylglucosamine-6-phosphate deacetylase [Candidatus Tokpelaia sp.]KAA6405542.1 N-acetylglucosamine-6-phosphate deacetylase [Candidatus Tokpelaia sp.]